MTNFFTYGWPWVGLGIAAVLLALLFLTNLFRSDLAKPRFRDLVWLAWLALPVYLLHQFEEHGIDLLGQPYAFRGSLCATLGFPDAAACPIPVAFITAVNLSAVWLAIPLSAWIGRRRPLVALSAFAIPMVNAVAHIGPAIVRGRYNPGAVTAVILFVPISIWVVRNALAQHAVKPSGVALVVASGIAMHVVLIASLELFIHGVIGEATLIWIQIANAFVPIAFALAGSRKQTGQRF